MKKKRDDITGDIKRLTQLPGKKRELLQVMGQVVVQMGTRAFSQASLRPIPWSARKSGGDHKLLLKTGALRRSLRVLGISGDSVKVGSDRSYAAIHQFGGTIVPRTKKALKWRGITKPVKSVKIPARPYLPFDKNKKLTPLGSRRVLDALRTAVRRVTPLQ